MEITKEFLLNSGFYTDGYYKGRGFCKPIRNGYVYFGMSIHREYNGIHNIKFCEAWINNPYDTVTKEKYFCGIINDSDELMIILKSIGYTGPDVFIKTSKEEKENILTWEANKECYYLGTELHRSIFYLSFYNGIKCYYKNKLHILCINDDNDVYETLNNFNVSPEEINNSILDFFSKNIDKFEKDYPGHTFIIKLKSELGSFLDDTELIYDFNKNISGY